MQLARPFATTAHPAELERNDTMIQRCSTISTVCLAAMWWAAAAFAAELPFPPELTRPAPITMAELAMRRTEDVSVVEVSDYISIGMDFFALPNEVEEQGIYYSLYGVGGHDLEAIRTLARQWLEQGPAAIIQPSSLENLTVQPAQEPKPAAEGAQSKSVSNHQSEAKQ
jgi:hypothetical protein